MRLTRRGFFSFLSGSAAAPLAVAVEKAVPQSEMQTVQFETSAGLTLKRVPRDIAEVVDVNGEIHSTWHDLIRRDCPDKADFYLRRAASG